MKEPETRRFFEQVSEIVENPVLGPFARRLTLLWLLLYELLEEWSRLPRRIVQHTIDMRRRFDTNRLNRKSLPVALR